SAPFKQRLYLNAHRIAFNCAMSWKLSWSCSTFSRIFALNRLSMDETISTTSSDGKPRSARVKNGDDSDLEAKIKYLISCIAWPGLMVLCMTLMAFGFMDGRPVLYFNVAYVILIITLFFLERWMPHEQEWTKPDGQTAANILHTLSSKGTS